MIPKLSLHRLATLTLAVGLAAGLCSRSLQAQSMTQGAISGTVFDATNAAVPNATILIHNEATGADQKLTSGSAGEFRAAQLAPGTYSVTISAPMFGTQKQDGVVVQVNEITEVNPHLTTGAQSTTVEVTAEVPVLKFESAEYGGHLDTTEIEQIPINNRRWSSLALTTPGVTNSSDGFGLLSFRAISPLLNVIEIDGADDNQAFFSEERGRTRAGYSTSQAAVREFTVNTGVYAADFGRAVGGVVNTVTKSGGNQLHGEAYFYNRNSSRSAFVPGASNTTFNATTQQYVTAPFRPKDNRNQYGFAAGGALVKDRLFWFYAFDAFRRNFPGTAKANNPGVFFVNADAALPTGQTCVIASSGATAGTITGGTGSAADTAACTLAARLGYTSYAAGATAFNNQLQALLSDLGSVPRFGNQLINSPKLDYQLSSKNHVSFLYHRLRWDSPGGVQTQGTNNYAVDTFGTDFVKLDYGVARLDSLITNSISNELRFQYGRELNDEGLQTPSAYTKANLLNSTGFGPEVALNASNGFMLGEPYYGFRPALPDERKTQIGDTLSLSFGKHNIRVGEDIVRNNDFQNYNFEVNGFYTYSQGTTANSQANYFADLLSHGKTCNTTGTGVNTTGNGVPCYNSFAQGLGASVFEFHTTDYGFFLQDDWKIYPRLTLNLGVRYDYESLPTSGFASVANAALPQTANVPSDKNNFAPRLGFAWDPYGAGKTVVRGGFGIYYGRIPNNYVLNTLNQTGATNVATTLASYTPTTPGAPILPNVATTAASGTASAQFFAPNFQNPYTEQFDLALQQDLGFRNVISISYIGALGRELPNYINVNLSPTARYTATYTVAPGTNGSCGPIACGSSFAVNTYAGRQCAATNLPGTCATTNNILVNTAFSAITESFSNINSNYHGLTVDLTNRQNKWVTYDVNYTWSHAMDFSQNASTAPGTNNWVDPFGNQRLNYGNSSQNVRNRVSGWANINAPGLKGNGPLTYITNGWSLKPYVQVQNGLPYSLLSSGTAAAQCTGPNCLQAANSGITGTGATAYLPFFGRNTLQYPRTINIDLRAQKAFKFYEHYNLELFGEAFNLANHQNVTGVNTTGYAISSPGTGVGTLTFQSNFGTTSSANTNYAYGPRVIQIGARVNF